MSKEKSKKDYHCDACGKLFVNHLGLTGTCAQYQYVKRLLRKCAPYVSASAQAEHLLDGFKSRRRKIDKLVEEIKAVLKI